MINSISEYFNIIFLTFNSMSKINSDFLKKSIEEMLANRKQRKFLEAVELQVGIRDYDSDKRFNGSVRLPYRAHNKLRVTLYLIKDLCSC